MCFSAEASLTSAAVIGTLGVGALALQRDRRELLLVALPVGFAAHQALEGAIWHELATTGATTLTGPLVTAWLTMAWLLLPVWVPLGVWVAEPPATRRPVQVALLVVGVLTAAALAWGMATRPTEVAAAADHLQYRTPFEPGWLTVLPYALATCVAPMLSSRTFVRVFGVGNAIALAVTARAAADQLSSVWCFFAAGLSAVFALHVLLARRAERTAATANATA